MRDMANTNSGKGIENPVKEVQPSIGFSSGKRSRRLVRLRPWVQTAMLGVWLAPLGRWLHSLPGCVFHCYACPLSSFACPVGVVASFSAAHLFPFLAVGVVLLVAALIGSLVCGWACPFGFVQDLIAKIPLWKIRIPNWLGVGRYLVLIGLVIVVPYLWGEGHRLFICRLCPAGALEAGLPRTLAGQIHMSLSKWGILAAFLVAAVFTYRPWCKVFCPLGGFLSLFNRFSVFHLRYDRQRCSACRVCGANCPMGVTVRRAVNTSHCNRCMECTTCGAIRPALGRGEEGLSALKQ